MKQVKKNRWLIGFAIVALGGCGVHVGNGLKKYQSDFGFEVQYHESLTVKESPDKTQVTISNEKPGATAAVLRRAGTNEPVSSVKFIITPGTQAGTADDLMIFSRIEAPGRRFEKVTINGSIGVKSVSEGDGVYSATYFFVTTKRSLVRAEVLATAATKAMFAPISESFQGGGVGAQTLKSVPEARNRVENFVKLGEVATVNFDAGRFSVNKEVRLGTFPELTSEVLAAYIAGSLDGERSRVTVIFTLFPHNAEVWTNMKRTRECLSTDRFKKRFSLRCTTDDLHGHRLVYLVRAANDKDMWIELAGGEKKEVEGAETILNGLSFLLPIEKNQKPLGHLD